MIALASRARRPKRQSPPPPGAWEQLSFVWPVTPPRAKRPPPRLTVLPPERPRTRADCLPGGWNAQRPCAYVGCKFHLYLQVTEDGDIQINHKDKEPWELAETCVLDQAAHGGLLLQEAAPLMDMTPQWMNVIELGARAKLQRDEKMQALNDPDEAQTLADRIIAAFAALRDRGQRLVSAGDVCRELGVDQRDSMMRIYVEIGRLARDGALEHDGGRHDGKRRESRLYWLPEETQG